MDNNRYDTSSLSSASVAEYSFDPTETTLFHFISGLDDLFCFGIFPFFHWETVPSFFLRHVSSWTLSTPPILRIIPLIVECPHLRAVFNGALALLHPLIGREVTHLLQRVGQVVHEMHFSTVLEMLRTAPCSRHECLRGHFRAHGARAGIPYLSGMKRIGKWSRVREDPFFLDAKNVALFLLVSICIECSMYNHLWRLRVGTNFQTKSWF